MEIDQVGRSKVFFTTIEDIQMLATRSQDIQDWPSWSPQR